jgi:choline dehydrogenase
MVAACATRAAKRSAVARRINGMIYMRGQARDYDGWAALTGEDGWNWAQQLCKTSRPTKTTTGIDTGADASADPGKPLHPTSTATAANGASKSQRLRWDVLEAFAEAAVEAGVPRPAATSTEATTHGVGLFRSQPEGRVGAGTPPRPSCARSSHRVQPARSGRKRTCGRSSTFPKVRDVPMSWAHCSGVVLRSGGHRVDGQGGIRSDSQRGRHRFASDVCSSQASATRSNCAKTMASTWCTGHAGSGSANLQDHLQIRAVFKVKSGVQDAQHAGQQPGGQGQRSVWNTCSGAPVR